MKAMELLSRYNTDRENTVKTERMLQWLREIEKLVENEVILTHEKDPQRDIENHFTEWGEESLLYVEEPYTDLYVHYIDMKIAYNHDEQDRYNMASTLFNNAYLTYQAWYNRTHMPLAKTPHRFRHEIL